MEIKREITLGQVINYILMIMIPAAGLLYGIWTSDISQYGKVAYTNTIILGILIGSLVLYHIWEWEEAED